VADSLLQDLRFAWRTLRRSPLFVVTVAGTMGLGLGLLASAFTILNAYLLKPIDLPNPRELYALSWNSATTQNRRFGLTDYEALQRDAQHFSRVAALLEATVMDGTVTTRGMLVTGNYFDLLGARPALGRLLRPDDAAARGGRAVVVLAHDLWRSRYGADPAIVGQRIPLGRQRYEVVGVAEPAARLGSQAGLAFWVPLTMAGAFSGPDPWAQPDTASLAVIGRLRPDAAVGAARAWLDVWLRQRFPTPSDAAPVTVLTQSLATQLPLQGPLVPLFSLIMAAFGLVLLVACANVTNLMLARALARQGEVTVRLALGASRWRVARQLIVESLLLAVPAAALGLTLAVVVARVFPRVVLATFPAGFISAETLQTILIPLDPDVRVMTLLAAAAVVAAVLITLAPTARLARIRLAPGSRSEVSSDRRGSRLRAGLVATQIGACALFVVGAVTLVNESARLANRDRNLDMGRVSWIIVDAKVRAEVASRLESDAAVEQVAVSSKPPLMNGALPVARATAPATSIVQNTGYTVVSPGYFPLFGIQIVRGRTFTPAEASAGAAVAIVSQATADAMWPGLDPLGQTLDLTAIPPILADRRPPHDRVRVVGVAEDVATGSITEGIDPTCVYFPTDLRTSAAMTLMARGRTESTQGLQAAMTSAVEAVAPDTPFQVIALRAMLGGAAWIFQAFGAVAWILGGVGLLFAYSGTHAVVSFMVAQRTREFGVRMALGASAWQIVGGMLRDMSRTAAIGLAVGLLGAAGVMRMFSSRNAILPDFGALPFLVGSAVVLVATAVAVLAPLRDAARTDPAQALRTE
jgi:predicted permease